ncbi:kinesin-related protein 4-like [Diorhabda sublineata]|uniref:kinesin-related protein 4-like n=1 Tax=Diorhabda sublineata TaxID=1163346 RepID=UPI0024E0ECDD|nr:kinesin-related protein 4-like [Diorhabda sublineata]
MEIENCDLFNEDYSHFRSSFPNENNKLNSAQISMITENQSTENYLKEFDCFYTEIMSKVKGIRNTPALNQLPFPEDIDIDEDKWSRNAKYTPEVKEQLEFIKKMDSEIDSVINQYKIEKEQRLQTQYELYNEITKHGIPPEKEADLFVNLCRFEFTESNNEQNEKNPDKNKKKKRDYNVKDKNNSFIIRNVNLAFSNCSLTDEEKCELEKLIQLDDEDDIQQCSNPFNIFSNKDEDIMKLKDIDEELKKVQLEQRLKVLESKLKALREIEDNDERNKKIDVQIGEDETTISENDIETDTENSKNDVQRNADDDGQNIE